jgi:putative ABC transport system permease protein
MELRPILSAMLRNKTGALLVALQIAITLAVVTNALFIINQRLEKIGRPSGMDTDNILFVQSYGFAANYNHNVTVQEDLELIRNTPGVIAASTINGIPLSGGGSSTSYKVDAQESTADVSGNYYEIDEQGLDALGVKLVAGRGFSHDIVRYYTAQPTSEMVPEVVMTRDMAKALFGTDEGAVGKRVHDNLGQSATIVGVVDHMLGAWVSWDKLSQVVYHPVVPGPPLARYIVRVEPGQRDALMKELETKLGESNRSRVISWVRTHDYYIERSYKSDTRMAVLLGVTIFMLISMTALGIVGLASFSVNARVKQIGTRRAVGARKLDILRYFMLENWVLTTAGVLVGCGLAYYFSYWLSTAYELPKLGIGYVIGGVFCMWVLGQLAVLVPARRAASVPPAVATRTV